MMISAGFTRRLLSIGKYLIVALLVHLILSTFQELHDVSDKDINRMSLSYRYSKKTQSKLSQRYIPQYMKERIFSVNPWYGPISVYWYKKGSDKNNGIFNPTVLPLPSTSPYKYLGSARIPGHEEKTDKLEFGLWRSNIVICFMNLIEMPNERYFECVEDPVIPDFPIPYAEILERLKGVSKDDFSWSKFIGAEDPRLAWNEEGMPYILYGMNSKAKTRHRTIWMSDVRYVFPEVTKIWSQQCLAQKSEPVFNRMEAGFTVPDDANLVHDLEKNWAPMLTDDKFLLHANLDPRLIFEPTVKDGEIQLDHLKGYDTDRLMKCFNKLYESPHKKDHHALHQATNMLRITTCFYGECVPDNSNTFYYQIFHVKNYVGYHYSRYIALWNITGPEYKFHSVVGPFEMPGMDAEKSHFIVSMNYVPEESHVESCGKRMDHGYLDSKLVLSVGDEDSRGKAFILTPQDILSSQHFCKEESL